MGSATARSPDRQPPGGAAPGQLIAGWTGLITNPQPGRLGEAAKELQHRRLSELECQAVVMRFFQDLKQKQIGTELG
jgi:hypothetical protein